MHSLENFIKKISNSLLDQHQIEHFEIYGEYYKNDILTSQLDSRGRWMGDIAKDSNLNSRLQITAFLRDGGYGQVAQEYLIGMEASELVERIIADARSRTKDASMKLSPRLDVQLAGLEIWDPRLPNISDEDRKEVVGWNMEVIKNASSKARGRLFRLEEAEWTRLFSCSAGRSLKEKSTRFSLFGEAELMVKPPRSLSKTIISRHFADVASRPISMGLVRSLDSGDRLSQLVEDEYFVVLEAKVVAEIIAAFIPCFAFSAVRSKESFLHKHLNKSIGPKKLHIIDDGSLPNGLNTRAFDMRGLPPKPLTLVCEGAVDQLYYMQNEAERENVQPTGHNGFGESLWPGNILVKSGRRSLNMILSEEELTLTCTHLLEPISFNILTGDLTCVVGCTLLREGKRRRLQGGKIQCNILELFACIQEIVSTQMRIDYVDASAWVLKGLKLEMLRGSAEENEDE